MKTDAFTKTMLTIIALALVAIGGQGALNQTTTVHAASAGQPYEYKVIVRFLNINAGSGFVGAGSTWKEDANDPPTGYSDDDAGLGNRIRELGSDGWEMFADVPLSNFMNVNDPKTRALNGVTTSERFVFKRKR